MKRREFFKKMAVGGGTLCLPGAWRSSLFGEPANAEQPTLPNAKAVRGLIEKDGDKCFNAAALIGPEGLVGKYRKNHLPFLGVDRFLDRGDKPIAVYETPIGNIGLHICYDCNFPESARVMMLLGADILVLPTNWPEARGKVAKYVVVTRAYENKVHLVAVDRVGLERGTRFIGLSKIINAWGDTLAEADGENEQIIYADVRLAEAREKHVIFKAGEFEIDIARDRRPELYGELTKIKGGSPQVERLPDKRRK